MRTASMATTLPAPLSVAPVPEIQLSRCPPTITTWSFNSGSVPGISATVSKPCSWSPVNLVSILTSTRDGHVMLHHARQTVVVLNHHHGVGNLDRVLRLLRIAREVRAVVVEDDAGTAAISHHRGWA